MSERPTRLRNWQRPQTFGFHELSGDRAGTYAMTVTRNWRMTFTKIDDQTIADLNLENYH